MSASLCIRMRRTARRSRPTAKPPASRDPNVTRAVLPWLLLLSSLSAPALAKTPDPADISDTANGVYPAAFYVANQPATALDMINRTPGFVLDEGEAVRGFTDNAGNVLINGKRPTSKNDSLSTVLNRIPASRVERVELLRGAATGVDMLGKTVLANVVLKADAAATAAVTVSDQWSPRDGRQAPRVKLEVSAKRGETLFEGSLDVQRSFDTSGGRGFDTVTDSLGRVLQRQRYVSVIVPDSVVATAAYSLPAAGGTLRFNGQVSTKQLKIRETGSDVATPSELGSQERDLQNKRQLELSVAYDRELAPSLSSESLFLQRLDNEAYKTRYADTFETDAFRERHKNGEAVARTTLTWKVSPAFSVVTGGEAAYNWLNGRSEYAVDGAPVPLPAAAVQIDEFRGELFARSTWTLSPRFTLETGVRVEGSHLTAKGDVGYQRTLVYPKPRLALTWSVDDRSQVRARIEREISQLDFGNFTAISSLNTGQIFTGNPTLSPEDTLVAEITYDRQFLKTGEWVLTYRRSRITDVIDRAIVASPSGVFEEPANIGDGSKDEWITSLDLPIDIGVVHGAHLAVEHTWRRSRVTDPTTQRKRAISGIVPSTGSVELYQDLERFKATWGVSYQVTESERYYSYDLIETDRYLSALLFYVEAKPAQGWNLRLQAGAIGTGAHRTLESYADTRLDVQAQMLADRRLKFGPLIGFRLRRDL